MDLGIKFINVASSTQAGGPVMRVSWRIHLVLSLLVICVGCSSPILSSRIVQDSSSWFVRLDSYQEATKSSEQYEHPAIWSVEELYAILGRLLLEERVGLMDSAKPPQPVFSSEEIRMLAPALRQAFQVAGPRDWISFYLSQPEGSAVSVTTGGMFLAGSRLHVVIANHHAPIAPQSEDFAAVRTNPFRSLRGSGGMLTFESSRFVMGRQANWSGGHKASASELILDHRTFLSILKSTGVGVPTGQIPVASPMLNQAEAAPGSPAAVTQDADHGTTILRLQEELERLKRRVEEQDAEIARLKRNGERSAPSKTTP